MRDITLHGQPRPCWNGPAAKPAMRPFVTLLFSRVDEKRIPEQSHRKVNLPDAAKVPPQPRPRSTFASGRTFVQVQLQRNPGNGLDSVLVVCDISDAVTRNHTIPSLKSLFHPAV